MVLRQDLKALNSSRELFAAIVMAVAILMVLLLISGCSNGNMKSDNAAAAQNAVTVINPALNDEIFRLKQEMTVRNLTEADTVKITEFSKDSVEQFYAKEFAWLVKHNEYEHLNHPLTFLDWYVRTGEETFCAPHELGHMAAYLEYNDVAYAEETFAVVKQKMHLWDEKQEINRKKYPKFYEGLSELKELMSKSIPLLEKKDYGNETIELLKQIDLNSVC